MRYITIFIAAVALIACRNLSSFSETHSAKLVDRQVDTTSADENANITKNELIEENEGVIEKKYLH